MLEKISQLQADFQSDLAKIADSDALEQFRIKYLGSKGALKSLMTLLKDVPKDQKPAFGQGANALRQQIQTAYNDKKSSLGSSATTSKKAKPIIDVTQPGSDPSQGRAHVITQTIEELTDVFGRMGFDIETGPEVEDENHNFIKLNIPEEHPARDPLDNFYLNDPGTSDDPGRSTHLLRTQTSTVQIRVMENTKPPIRIVSMGRVYRPDEHDATHSSMFHQIEGLYVDEGVSMVDLRTTLSQFVHAYFGPKAEVRLRPSFFPFTEPSAELDIKMQIKGKWEWVEVGGCGMVDPNVFKAVGYDPEKYTGFAFGLGIERLAMKKYAISDIRWLYENDIRFLSQF